MFKHLPPVYKGILLAFAGYSGFSIADLCAKWLMRTYPVDQLIAIEHTIAIVVLLALSPVLGGLSGLGNPRNLKIHALRIVLHFGLALLLNYCYRRFPLADVYTMLFTKPFFAALLAIWLFKERGTLNRWIAIALGFGGVVIAMRPGAAAFDPFLLIPLASAILIAILFMSARFLDKPSLFSIGFIPMAGTTILSWPLAVDGFVPVAPLDWPIFALTAVTAATGVICVSMAFRIAAAAAVAPVVYSQMIWALIGGYLVFGDKPDVLMLAGCAIVIASGIYLVRSERVGRG